MVAISSVSFGPRISARVRIFYLFNLAEDGASKNATPVSARAVHTLFCTPNTDDWTGGVTRRQPPDLEFLSANRRAQILTT